MKPRGQKERFIEAYNECKQLGILEEFAHYAARQIHYSELKFRIAKRKAALIKPS